MYHLKLIRDLGIQKMLLVLALKNITATLQDKQSFWKDVSEDKLWETRKQRMLDSKAKYNIRPQKQK